MHYEKLFHNMLLYAIPSYCILYYMWLRVANYFGCLEVLERGMMIAANSIAAKWIRLDQIRVKVFRYNIENAPPTVQLLSSYFSTNKCIHMHLHMRLSLHHSKNNFVSFCHSARPLQRSQYPSTHCQQSRPWLRSAGCREISQHPTNLWQYWVCSRSIPMSPIVPLFLIFFLSNCISASVRFLNFFLMF